MKKLVLIVAVIASLFVPVMSFAFSPAYVSAAADPFSSSDAKTQACAGINGCKSKTSLDTVIAAALNILSLIAGIAAVIMIMLSGFKYITSGGDSGKISSAKNTLVYAIIGVIVVAMSQFIARFAIERATTVTPPKKKAAIVRMVA